MTYTKLFTSKFPFESGKIIPFSVTMPVIFCAGVTSKAGFQHCILEGALDVLINSAADRSSIGIASPLAKVTSNDVIGAAT